LIDLSSGIRCTSSRLEPCAFRRYSNRQGQNHPLTGVVGRVVLTSIPPDLWPYLVLGQWIHVGKESAFGMGKYVLEPAEPPSRPSAPLSDPRPPHAFARHRP
jgi:CRISPR/Cas system endoribonuclease Cas6 (RAMP superfamily)